MRVVNLGLYYAVYHPTCAFVPWLAACRWRSLLLPRSHAIIPIHWLLLSAVADIRACSRWCH